MVEAVSFRFSQNVQDLEGKGVLDGSPERVDRLPADEQEGVLKGLRTQDPLSRDTVNQLYPYVRFYWEISEKARALVGEVLSRFTRDIFHSQERLEGDVETLAMAREVAKYYVYFLVFIIRDREKREAEAAASGLKKTTKKKAATNAFDDENDIVVEDDEEPVEDAPKKGSKAVAATAWSVQRDKHIEALLEILWVNDQATDLGRIFEAGVPEEGFISLFWQTGELLLERGLTVVRAGTKTRDMALKLLAVPSVLFHEAVGTSMASSLWNLMRQNNHASSLVVELLSLLMTKFKVDRLARDLIQQLGESEDAHKNTGAFIEELAEHMPALLLSNLALVLPYLNNKDSYQMRCSIIRALPHLVAHLHHLSTGEEAKHGTRIKILETLADWGHDVSPFVRAAVCSAWNMLVETKTLPLTHLITALNLALEAARDKKVLVRKQALALLENMLATNPFGPDLSLHIFVAEIERRKGELEELLKVEEEERAKKEAQNEADADEEEKPQDELMAALQVAEEAEQETESDKRKKVLMEALNFLKCAVMFIDRFDTSTSYFCALLTSKTDEDVLGVIRLFATAKAFKLASGERGVRSMLKLIWSPSDKIRKVLLETMERLYIADTQGDKRFVFPAKVIAHNLVDLAEGATLDELTSLGEVVSEMRLPSDQSLLKRTILPMAPLEELWSLILNHKHDIARARVALCVLSMTASSTPSIVDDARASTKLVETVLASSECSDLALKRWAFHCFSVAARARNGVCLLEESEKRRVEMSAIEVVCLQCPETRSEWFSSAKAALDLIVDLSDSAERSLMFCVENLYEQCKQSNFTEGDSISALLFVAGHVALKLLIVAEKLVSAVKRARGDNSKQISQKKAEERAEEEDMLGASAEDDTEDLLYRQLAEQDLFHLGDDSVLGACLELSKRLCLASQCSPQVRQCAVLCLSKFMACSERVCEENLALFFTVLRDAPEAETRSVVVISEGDLAFRFPNSLEPYTSFMYKCLRDQSVLVRKNGLMVLTHLALNDMIKVRGEVSEIALKLEDEDKGVRDLARFFFAELSKRGTNPIYNLLPDILGSLSRENPGQSKFKSLAKFLLEFVDKDKQCEQLCDKLCNRIATTLGGAVGDFSFSVNPTDLQICRDLCFCIEQLKMSDALLKRLADDSDLFKCIRPVLGDSACYQSLSRLVQKAAPKSQETKRTLEELQEKMKKLHESQAQDMAAFDKANSLKKGKALKVNEKAAEEILERALMEQKMKDENEETANKANKKGGRKGASAKTVKATDVDSKEDLEESVENVTVTKARPARRAVSRKQAKDSDEEDDGNSSSEENVVSKPVSRRARGRAAAEN